jgi:hypothetical protein
MFTLYIPDFVHPADLDRIKETFEKLELAKVREVEFLEHTECEYCVEPELYGAARIHIDYWYDNGSVAHMQDRIKNPIQEARLVYDDPHYWVLEEEDDDTNQIIAGMSQSLRENDRRISEVNNYLHHNYSCVQYLMSEENKRWNKDKRDRKTADNYKAQRKWQRRLRPRTSSSPYLVKEA